MSATGDPRVDQAVAVLDTLDDRPLAEHLDVYTQVHGLLQDALAALDEG